MSVVINLPHGIPVSSNHAGAAPTLADLKARTGRVEQAIAILIQGSGDKARDRHLQKFGGGRSPDGRSEASAMAGVQDKKGVHDRASYRDASGPRWRRQASESAREIRSISAQLKAHYDGARS